MKAIILEDEAGAAQNLLDLLKEADPHVEVMSVLESVREALDWMDNNPEPDLGFFDIRLADGESFEIFEQRIVPFPVIFTTAYDEYALKAFKVNSIDYLLKPLDKGDLEAALNKYQSLYERNDLYKRQGMQKIIRDIRRGEGSGYKKSILVYVRDRIIPLPVDQIAYFYLDHKLVYCMTREQERYVMDQPLDKIGSQLDPGAFFRANRQYLVSRQAILSVSQHLNRKLKLNLSPAPENEVLISKTKGGEFKRWLEA
jgi:two-component system LytT family response regulator